jgi:hypothetical protein
LEQAFWRQFSLDIDYSQKVNHAEDVAAQQIGGWLSVTIQSNRAMKRKPSSQNRKRTSRTHSAHDVHSQEGSFSMKQFIGLAALIFVGIAGWRLAGQLSSDALGMAVGVLFGIMAGVPTALLVMASGRRRAAEEEESTTRRRQPQNMQQHPYYGGGYGPGGYPPQPPVIVLAGPGMGQQGYPQGYADPYGQQRRALPPPEAVDVRQFKVVGEKEEWVDEW